LDAIETAVKKKWSMQTQEAQFSSMYANIDQLPDDTGTDNKKIIIMPIGTKSYTRSTNTWKRNSDDYTT